MIVRIAANFSDAVVPSRPIDVGAEPGELIQAVELIDEAKVWDRTRRMHGVRQPALDNHDRGDSVAVQQHAERAMHLPRSAQHGSAGDSLADIEVRGSVIEL